VKRNGFAVSIILHTAQKTILSVKHAGDSVNLENDYIGMYVARLVKLPEPESRIKAENVNFMEMHDKA